MIKVQSFNEKDQINLKDMLYNKYNKQYKKYVIRIKKKSMNNLRDIVKPFILSSFMYKLK